MRRGILTHTGRVSHDNEARDGGREGLQPTDCQTLHTTVHTASRLPSVLRGIQPTHTTSVFLPLKLERQQISVAPATQLVALYYSRPWGLM